MNPGDAWEGAERIIDESACPICLSEMCEGNCRPETPDPATDPATEAAAETEALNPGLLADAVDVADEGRQIHAAGIRYVVDGIIPDYGMAGMIVAQTKVGKSTLASACGSSVARGVAFLGKRTEARRVLVLAAEDPPEYVAWLQRHLQIERGRMTFYRGPIRFDGSGLERVCRSVEAGGYGLVLVSSWQSVIRGLVKDENDNAGGVLIAEYVKGAARQTGVPWLIDAHSGKGEDQRDEADPLLALRGASSVAGAFDYALSLRYADGAFGSQRRLSGKGRFVSFEPMLLNFDIATSTYQVLSEGKSATAESIWLQIETTGALDATPRTATEIAERAGLASSAKQVTATHRRQVREALKNRDGVGIEVERRRGNMSSLYRRLEAGA